MVDKAINQKVRDLLQSKFTNLPKTAPKLKVAKPPKVPKIVKTKNVMQESIKSASSQAPKNENKFITPLKNSTFSQKDHSDQKPIPIPIPSSIVPPISNLSESVGLNKSGKKFKPLGSGSRKSFSKPVSSQSKASFLENSLKKLQIEIQPIEEIKEDEDTGVAEAILSAKPIDELVDLGSLDNTGEIVEKILYGNIEEKLDALVLFNEIVTSNIFVCKESLIKNAEFISRTFSDVIDGIFYRYKDDFPTKFVKYLIQILFQNNLSEQEFTIVSEIVLLRLQPKNLDMIVDYECRNEITKDLNRIMINLIEFGDISICFYSLIDLMTKYDKQANENQMCQMLANCLLKVTKRISKEIHLLNIERVLFSLHVYLIKYSSNLVKFNSNGKEGNKSGFMAAKNLVYEIVKAKKSKFWDYCAAVNAHPIQDKYIQSWAKLIIEKLDFC